MERLRVGDRFYAQGSSHDPYTVKAVLKDGYIVKQAEDSEEQYETKTIHGLFETRGWVLNRVSKPLFTQANADLFRI